MMLYFAWMLLYLVKRCNTLVNEQKPTSISSNSQRFLPLTDHSLDLADFLKRGEMAMRALASRLPPELVALTRRHLLERAAAPPPAPAAAIRSFSASPHPRQATTRAADKSFFATTPIFYVNADPHIGHLHSTLLADVYTRHARLRDPATPAIMCTGTDEHGLKIQRVAEAKGIPPKELCDNDLARAANIDYTYFIRTTEDRHRVAVEHVWRELERRGYIYKSSYSGWYAVSDEAYVPESQVAEVIDEKSGEKYMASPACTETGTRVEWMQEENYKFRLSAFRDRLVQWLSAAPTPVQPPSRSAALLSALDHPLSTDLNDLSISRPTSRLSWGIRVPGDPEHTIYVWIDALVNYMTVAGYPWQGGEEFAAGQVWPPDLQVVGKDIIRFHALYLPAILLALDLPLPKHILTHGHWTMDRFKMSKSRGNVANPFEAMKLWGVDAMRMYLMRVGGNSAGDADYSAAEIERFYRKDLAGQMGNLLARVTAKKLTKKLDAPELMYTMPEKLEAEDAQLVKLLEELPDVFEQHLSSFEVYRALAAVFDALAEANRHVQQLSPWLATASPSAVHRALFFGSETLRMSAILLQPFMPTKSEQLLDMLGVPADRRAWACRYFGQGGARVAVTGGKTHLWPPILTAAEPTAQS
ncbi:methionyl-tRNA synthetase [Rhodotorula mucilaginosa]|uniref:Probable methionine--tRNA ligase, mitochondrial n=1 Tax=Rhodotorula mucilaginosa TaxID=5537 RepID=A0A9P7B9Q6_RHOMI|nr:methionyl-tRNA synthetase [Rhodotorula mucilaginosa]